MAIILAMQYPGFEILGITTSFGNATLEQATNNALRIVELSGKSIPDGEDGLGNTRQPAPSLKPHEKPVDSGFAANIQEVVLMGGALYGPGNVSPVAEANVSGDPHAADLVFSTPWKVTMIGLDVTTKVRLNDDILARVKDGNKRYGEFIDSISRFHDDFHRKEQVVGGFYVHDPSAVIYLIAPELFETKEGPVRVVCEGIAIGQTIMTAYDYQFQLPPWKDQPLVKAAVTVDRARFEKTMDSLLVGGQQ